jgi:UDP-N-acetylglucosamine--N-acetylmuramyl-(pentapeptide) pyrophosphoryl-undecaprenol N-acetylglucosamine transferase
LQEGNADRGKAFLGIDSSEPIILVFGGSLGAQAINQQVRNTLTSLQDKYVIVHVVGAGNIDEAHSLNPRYIQKEFLLDEFGDVLAAADLVVARSGANTIYELLATRKPHILIPLSARASRGDQLENARAFTEAGYSRMIKEEDLGDELFLGEIDRAYRDRSSIASRLAEFEIRDSVLMISDIVIEIAGGKMT